MGDLPNEKAEPIEALTRLIRSTRSGSWQFVDHWDADLFAIGIVAGGNRHRLVYVSAFRRPPGHFFCEFEADGEVVKRFENVETTELLKLVEEFLGP